VEPCHWMHQNRSRLQRLIAKTSVGRVMALKDYPTSELQAEVMRRQHNCPFCVVMRAELDSIAGALGAARMDDAGGWHYEAVAQLLRERDHYGKACVELSQNREPPWLEQLCAALGWHGGTVHEAIHAVKRLVDAAKERPNDSRMWGEMQKKRGQ